MQLVIQIDVCAMVRISLTPGWMNNSDMQTRPLVDAGVMKKRDTRILAGGVDAYVV